MARPARETAGLRDANETADLADSIAASADNRDAGCNAFELTYADRRSCDRTNVAQEGGNTHAAGGTGIGAVAAGGVEKACIDLEAAKKRANGSMPPRVKLPSVLR